jgi:hypothetical protein
MIPSTDNYRIASYERMSADLRELVKELRTRNNYGDGYGVSCTMIVSEANANKIEEILKAYGEDDG